MQPLLNALAEARCGRSYLRRRDKQTVMTVEHRAAPGLNDIEIELADDGEGPALRLRRQVGVASGCLVCPTAFELWVGPR